MTTFYTGNTGGSTGPHLDLRVFNPATGSYEDPSKYTSYLTSGGKPFQSEVTSGYGMRTHPIHGDQRMHHGIDYATPTGTALNIDGKHLSTWEDSGGGGIMSQYLISTDDGNRELLLLHGDRSNKITGTGAVTDYDTSAVDTKDIPEPAAVLTPESDPKPSPGTETIKPSVEPTAERTEAVERVQNYSKMNKAEMNAAYDKMRASDPGKAATEGMKMHKAFFGKI